MRRASMIVAAVTVALLGGVAAASLVTAAEEQKGAAEDQDVVGENEIYGGDLMTLEERREVHMKYCSAKTDAERDALFLEHGKRIHARAIQKGVGMPQGEMNTQKTWIRHTCPNMDVMHGRTNEAGHHGSRHNMKDVSPGAEGTAPSD